MGELEVTEVLGLRRLPQSSVTIAMWMSRAWPGSLPGPRKRMPHSGNAEGVLSGDMVIRNAKGSHSSPGPSRHSYLLGHGHNNKMGYCGSGQIWKRGRRHGVKQGGFPKPFPPRVGSWTSKLAGLVKEQPLKHAVCDKAGLLYLLNISRCIFLATN